MTASWASELPLILPSHVFPSSAEPGGPSRAARLGALWAKSSHFNAKRGRNGASLGLFRTRGGGPHHQFAVAVREVQNGCERKLLPHQLPPYGVEYYYIPGFVAIKDTNK